MPETHASRTLRRLREEAGKSRQKVATDLEISERQLIRHELGTTPLSLFHIIAYADYYGVSVDDLRDGEVVA